MKYNQGDTALIINLKEINNVIDKWRLKYDDSAQRNIPSHITLIAPFKNKKLFSEFDEQYLKKLFNINSFELTFNKINSFDDIYYLDVNQKELIINLINKINKQYPNYLPYKGIYKEIIPHLTIGKIENKDIVKEIKKEIKLPITIKADKISLYSYDSFHNTWLSTQNYKLK